MSFGDYMYAFVFSIYLGVELLGHWVCMSSSRDPVIFGYIIPSWSCDMYISLILQTLIACFTLFFYFLVSAS